MRSDRVVIVTPEGKFAPCVLQTIEDFLIQKFNPEAAVEALNESVLLRLTRIDVVPRHLVLVGPFQDRPTGELGAITPLE